jgi:hypothetical protein
MLDTSLFLDLHFHLAAANIVEGAQTGSDISASFANDFWSNVFQMGLYGRIVVAAKTIAGIGVIYRGYYYLQDASKNCLDIEKVVGSLFTLLITILILTNMSLSMNIVLGMRNFGNSINDTLMSGITGDLATLQATRSLSGLSVAQPYFDTFKSSMKICAPKAEAACYQQAVAQLRADVSTINPPDSKVDRVVNKIIDEFNRVAQAQINSNTAPTSTAMNTSIVDRRNALQTASTTVLGWVDNVTNVVNNTIEGIISLILTVIAIGFYFALELTLIMFGLTFPINVALSLFDPAPIKSWLGNFWLLVNAKICFCIIVGIISYLQLWMQTSSNNPLSSLLLIMTGLLMAFYAPVITFFYVQGSALALAGAMNAIPGSVVGGAARGVGGAVGKVASGAAGAFMGGAMKGAGVGKMGQNFGRKLAGKK